MAAPGHRLIISVPTVVAANAHDDLTDRPCQHAGAALSAMRPEGPLLTYTVCHGGSILVTAGRTTWR